MEITAVPDTSQLRVATGASALGDLLLWFPEAIITDTGASSVYPAGAAWKTDGSCWVQRVLRDHLFGPGNCPEVEPGVLECEGIRYPKDSPVEWETRVTTAGDALSLGIRLTNVGDRPIRKAGAAVCLRFLHPGWWCDECTYVLVEDAVTSLAELGRDAGRDNGFQAYLLRGQTYSHAFYREFWGFNRARLDRPVMVSCHAEEGLCVGIEADTAYFLHSNRGNPCTDVMLALGDIDPGQVTEAAGSVWVRKGSPEKLLTSL